MRLFQLVEDFSPNMGKAMSDDHYQLAYNAVKKHEMDKSEIRSLAKELEDGENFDRTAGSAEFVLNRMHILVHGAAPQGETEARAETMFSIPKKMIDFANRKGIDTFENIKKAKLDLKGRSVKRKEPEAKKMMSDYFQANKDKLPKDIGAKRDDIIKDIMAGLTPAEAFNRHH